MLHKLSSPILESCFSLSRSSCYYAIAQPWQGLKGWKGRGILKLSQVFKTFGTVLLTTFISNNLHVLPQFGHFLGSPYPAWGTQPWVPAGWGCARGMLCCSLSPHPPQNTLHRALLRSQPVCQQDTCVGINSRAEMAIVLQGPPLTHRAELSQR